MVGGIGWGGGIAEMGGDGGLGLALMTKVRDEVGSPRKEERLFPNDQDEANVPRFRVILGKFGQSLYFE